jgi:CheY-like chemotaxis protein
MRVASYLPPAVLLVDDCRDGLLVRRALLEEQGLLVQIVLSGEEGLKLFDRCHFDVVVTDYRMPGINGVELIRQLRERKPQVRTVLLSKAVEPLGLTEQSTGADAVIAKNCNEASVLVRTVKRLVNRPASRKPVGSQTRARSLARVRA